MPFTPPKMTDGRPDFSFSGLKTAVLHHVRRCGLTPVAPGSQAGAEVCDLVASFQRAVVQALLVRVEGFVRERRPRSLLLSGGVAANSVLRRDAEAAARALGLAFFVPPLHLTTDNAAMIGAAGFLAFERGVRAGWDLNAEAALRLT